LPAPPRASRGGRAHGLRRNGLPELSHAHRRVGVLSELRHGPHRRAHLGEAGSQARDGEVADGDDLRPLRRPEPGRQPLLPGLWHLADSGAAAATTIGTSGWGTARPAAWATARDGAARLPGASRLRQSLLLARGP